MQLFKWAANNIINKIFNYIHLLLLIFIISILSINFSGFGPASDTFNLFSQNSVLTIILIIFALFGFIFNYLTLILKPNEGYSKKRDLMFLGINGSFLFITLVLSLVLIFITF